MKLVQEQGWQSDGQMSEQVRQNEGMRAVDQSAETNHSDKHTDVKRGSIKLFGSIKFIATILAMAEVVGGAKGLSSCHTDQKFNSPDLPHTRDTYNFNLPDGKRSVRVIVEAWENTPPTEF